MQNHRLKGKNKYQVQYFSEKARSCRVPNWRLVGNLIGYTFVQNLRLNVQNTKKSSLIHHGKTMIMPNTKFSIGCIFDNLYFQAKNQVKRKKYNKINPDILLKNYAHAEFKSSFWKQVLQPIFRSKGKKMPGYTFMQNRKIKVKNTIKSSLHWEQF